MEFDVEKFEPEMACKRCEAEWYALRMNKIAFPVLIVAAILATGSYIYYSSMSGGDLAAAGGYKDATYVINGERVTFVNGVAETAAAPGSATRVMTRHFGNELVTDLDGDGREDVAFVVTQTTGGSGTFYYAVAARNTSTGYVGSDGYLLGDRIAPQSTNVSPNPRHKHVVVFNYADRTPDEPFTATPSVGKSVYLKLDASTMQWGIVEPDFPGEAR